VQQLPYEGSVTPPPPPPPPPATGVDLKGQPHEPPAPLDSSPQFEAPGTTRIRLSHLLWPALTSVLILALVVTFNPFSSAGPNPLLSTSGNSYVALAVQFLLIFVSLQILEFLFGLTGSPLFLWGAFMAVVAGFFGLMYFFDRNFFDPSYKISLGPLPLIWETVKSYLASPF